MGNGPVETTLAVIPMGLMAFYFLELFGRLNLTSSGEGSMRSSTFLGVDADDDSLQEELDQPDWGIGGRKMGNKGPPPLDRQAIAPQYPLWPIKEPIALLPPGKLSPRIPRPTRPPISHAFFQSLSKLNNPSIANSIISKFPHNSPPPLVAPRITKLVGHHNRYIQNITVWEEWPSQRAISTQGYYQF